LEKKLSFKILIIDDDNLFLNYSKNILQSNGYDVEIATNGKEALQIFSKNPGLYRIMLVDLLMPIMNGIEFIKEIRKISRDFYPYIIIVTIKNETEILSQSLDVGGDDFIVKPINEKILVKHIESALRKLTFINLDALLDIPLKLLDSKDKYTTLHSENVKIYTSILTKLCFEENLIENKQFDTFLLEIQEAARLHDVGKIVIPDFIWMKPGTYTEEERRIMQLHTTKGAEAIDAALKTHPENSILKTCYNVVKYHHERWDGKGYPEGLKGKEIPIEARIVAVADVFDALTTRRIYRSEYPAHEAIEIMINEEDGHFDPDIFGLFLKYKNLFIDIAKTKLKKQLEEIKKL